MNGNEKSTCSVPPPHSERPAATSGRRLLCSAAQPRNFSLTAEGAVGPGLHRRVRKQRPLSTCVFLFWEGGAGYNEDSWAPRQANCNRSYGEISWESVLRKPYRAGPTSVYSCSYGKDMQVAIITIVLLIPCFMDSHYKPTLPRPVHLPGVLGARGRLRSTKTEKCQEIGGTRR